MTLAFISETLGTVWWSILVFAAGALVGVPAWNWVRKFFPWNKD